MISRRFLTFQYERHWVLYKLQYRQSSCKLLKCTIQSGKPRSDPRLGAIHISGNYSDPSYSLTELWDIYEPEFYGPHLCPDFGSTTSSDIKESIMSSNSPSVAHLVWKKVTPTGESGKLKIAAQYFERERQCWEIKSFGSQAQLAAFMSLRELGLGGVV